MSHSSGNLVPNSSTTSKDSLAYSLLQRALDEAGQGQLEFALVSCRQALLLAPQSFPAHSLHAMLLRRLARLNDALAASKAALRISPQNQFERARFTELRTALQNGQKECVVSVEQWQAFVREIEASTPVSALPAAAVDTPPRAQSATISTRSLLVGGFVTLALLLVFLTAREMRLAATKMSAGATAAVQSPPTSAGSTPAAAPHAPAGSTPAAGEAPAAANPPAAGPGNNAIEPAAPAASPGSTPPASSPDPAPQTTPGTSYAPPQPNVQTPQQAPARRTVPAAPPRVYSVPATPSAPTEQRNEIAPRVPQPATGDAVEPRFSNP